MSWNRDVVNRYYEAFRSGDLTGIAIADDVVFTCPFPTVHGADAFRAAVAMTTQMLQGLAVERQAEVDDSVITIGGLDFGMPDGPVRFAETITVVDGQIAAVDLIFDTARMAPPA